MKPIQLIISWDGASWDIQADGNPPVGTRITVTIPTVEKPSKGSKKKGPLLFPKGTFVYYPIDPDKNDAEAWALWENHKADHRPVLSSPPDKVLIPILLEEDLYLSGVDSTNLAPCRCSHSGNFFKSLNQAASAAVNRWTNRPTDSVGVFKSLCFLHDGMRLRLELRRAQITDGTPLPSRQDADEGTPWLFGEEGLS